MRTGRAIVAALGGLGLATTAHGQSANDFRLPEATSSPSARPQGPVDPDNPTVVAPRTTPRAAPTPTPTSAPSAQPVAIEPQPSPSQAARRPVAAPPGAASRQVSVPTATNPATTSDLALPLPDSSASPEFSTFPQAGTPPPATPANQDVGATETAIGWWPYFAGGAGLAAALFALVWWRRRRHEAEPIVEFERPVVAAPPPPEPLPPVAQEAPKVIPEPGLSAASTQAGLDLQLEARRMNASLVATTLSYRLVVTNRGATALSALAIEGDMIAAHASLPPERQVGQPAQRLELRHALAALAPGESAEFSGDIRLPLSAITPIRAGEAAYFVPLARFRIEAGAISGLPQVLARTFVVGEAQGPAGAGLRPFRLDLGPRTYSRLDQRAVN